MEITNETSKPISVPLPGGKKLFLAPKKSGQINPKALSHPGLAKLVEAGDLSTDESTSKRAKGEVSVSAPSSGGAPKGSTGAMRQSGDR